MGALIGIVSGSASGWAAFSGLVAFFVFCLVKGWLVIGTQVKVQLDSRDREVTQANLRAEDYKAMYNTSQDTVGVLQRRMDATNVVAYATADTLNRSSITPATQP